MRVSSASMVFKAPFPVSIKQEMQFHFFRTKFESCFFKSVRGPNENILPKSPISPDKSFRSCSWIFSLGLSHIISTGIDPVWLREFWLPASLAPCNFPEPHSDTICYEILWYVVLIRIHFTPPQRQILNPFSLNVFRILIHLLGIFFRNNNSSNSRRG